METSNFIKTDDGSCYYHLRDCDVIMVNIVNPLIIIHQYSHFKYMKPKISIDISNEEFNNALNDVIVKLGIFESVYSN